MKRIFVLGILCGVLGMLSSCLPTLPTLTPTASQVPNTVEKFPTPVLGTAYGTVNVRNDDGVVVGYLEPGDQVKVYADVDGWCFIDPALEFKVWCGCIGIGGAGCTKK